MLPVIQFTRLEDLLKSRFDSTSPFSAPALYVELLDIETGFSKEYGISYRLICSVIRYIANHGPNADHIGSLTLPHGRLTRVGNSPMEPQHEVEQLWNQAEARHKLLLETLCDGYQVFSGVIDIGETKLILGAWPTAETEHEEANDSTG